MILLTPNPAVSDVDIELPATASQAEMEAGTETALRSVSPLLIAEAIAALAAAPTTSHAPFTGDLDALAGTWTPAVANGAFQRGTLTGDLVILVPSDGTEGDRLELRLTASGADRYVAITTDVQIPSDSAIAWPKLLTSGLSYTFLLRRGQTNWRISALVGGDVD